MVFLLVIYDVYLIIGAVNRDSTPAAGFCVAVLFLLSGAHRMRLLEMFQQRSQGGVKLPTGGSCIAQKPASARTTVRGQQIWSNSRADG